MQQLGREPTPEEIAEEMEMPVEKVMEIQKMKKEKEEIAASVSVYVLNTDVSSGQTITTDMYTKQNVNRNRVPSNAIGNMEILDAYALQDKEGNQIIR